MEKYADLKVPKYLQVKNILLSKIRDGSYSRGSLLPSEGELIKKYQVSSITVRRSFQELVNEGYVIREPGRGSFVKGVLKEKTWQTTGLILCDADPASYGYHDLIRELERCLYLNHRHLMLLTLNQTDVSERKKTEEAISRNEISSFFLLGKVSLKDYKFAKSFELPVLILANTGLSIHLPQVKYDTCKAGKMATSYLLSSGYQQIGFLNGASYYPIARELFKGFEEAYKEKGLFYRKDFVYWTAEKHAYLEAQELLEKMNLSISAAILLEEGTIADTARMIKEKGIRVPEDLALIGVATKDYYLEGKTLLSAVKFSSKELVEKISLASKKMEQGKRLRYEDKVVQAILQPGDTLQKVKNYRQNSRHTS